MTQSRAPRPAPKYDFGVHGQSSDGNLRTLILKDSVRAIVKKPSWKGTETVFRPSPSLRYDDPTQFEPYRLDPGGRNFFGNWIRRYDCWWGAGRDATTMLIHNPETGDRTYDKWSTPLGVLFRAVDTACKNGQGHPEWYPLREGSAGRGKQLRPPSECYLMQGIMLVHNDKKTYEGNKAPLGWGPNPPVIFMLSQGAGKSLEEALNEENDGFRGQPADFEARYKYGDPVAVESGRYFHFFEKGHDPRTKYGAKPVGHNPYATGGWARGAGSSPGKTAGDIGFDLYIDSMYDNIPAQIPPDSIEMFKSKWLFWEDILYFATVQEQVRTCFEQFPLSACMYAFEGQHNDWIPEEYRRKFYGTVQTTVPAVVPGQQPPVPAGVPAVVPGQQPAAQPSGWTSFAGQRSGFPGGFPGQQSAAQQPVPQQVVAPQAPEQQSVNSAPEESPKGTGVWGFRPGQPAQSAQPSAVRNPFASSGAAHTDSSVPGGSVDDNEGYEGDEEVPVEDLAAFDPPAPPTQPTPSTPSARSQGVPSAEDPAQALLREDAEAVAKMMAARQRR